MVSLCGLEKLWQKMSEEKPKKSLKPRSKQKHQRADGYVNYVID